MSKFTNNQLPGDLDYCVFYKKNNKKTIAFLFEFKTHNLDKPIKDENMSNYKAQDFRRFSVFNFLLRQIKDRQNYSPIFVYLAWGTDITLVNHENIKLDFMYYSEESRSLKYFYNSIIKNPELSNSYQELKQTLNDAIKKFKEDIK